MEAKQLRSIVAFAKVAQLSSFSRAADELGITAPALSQTIRALETGLGVRLFQRTTRRVGLTEAGKTLLGHVMPALEQIETGFLALASQRTEPTGLLRINAPRIAVQTLLQPVLPELARRYPKLQLEIAVDDGFSDLIADGNDCGIRLGERLAPNVIAVPLGPPLLMALVAAPEYLAQQGIPRHPSELGAHRALRYRFVTKGTLYRWEFERGGQRFEMDPPPVLIANDWPVLIAALRAGLGITQMIRDWVKTDIERGTLVELLPEWSTPFQGWHLYYSSRRQVPLKLRVMIDLLKERHPARVETLRRTPQLAKKSRAT